MTKIYQFRFYAEGNPNNNPTWSWRKYCLADTFKSYSPIISLGIQTLPGTKIYLNNSIQPIIIGNSGIFELDVRNTSASISNIRIDQESMETIKNMTNGYIIIDIVYEEQEEINV